MSVRTGFSGGDDINTRVKHLEEVGVGYFEHMRLALANSLLLAFSSVTLLVHALIPCLFTKTASSMIKKVVGSFPKKKADRILVRFNTKWREDPHARQWRVLVNGTEVLAHKVSIQTNSETVEEEIAGEQKFHFLCLGSVIWEGTLAKIV